MIYKNLGQNRKNDAKNPDLEFEESRSIEMFINFFEQSSKEIINEHNINVESFKRIIRQCIQREKGHIFVAKKDNVWLSAVFISDFAERLTLINFSTTNEGYKEKANTFLLIQIFKHFAQHRSIFDFEGSEIPGVKEYYRRFKPLEEYYYIYEKQNKWISKIKNLMGK